MAIAIVLCIIVQVVTPLLHLNNKQLKTMPVMLQSSPPLPNMHVVHKKSYEYTSVSMGSNVSQRCIKSDEVLCVVINF